MQHIISEALTRNGIPTTIDTQVHSSLVDLFLHTVDRHGSNAAFSSLGHTLSYEELHRRATQFTRYLQRHTDLRPGDRIAIQLPNLIQYPVVLFGALQAGLVVVNTNPMYSARELEHQLNDAGARAVVTLANIARPLNDIVGKTAVEKVIITELADLHPAPRRWLVNSVVRYVKRMVPSLSFPDSISLPRALNLGGDGDFERVPARPEDLAILQYTGGTTGVAKGAMLSHRNLLANVEQCKSVLDAYYTGESGTMVMPLPLYHIYSFLNSLLMMASGHHSVLIPDPRNIEALVKDMQRYPVNFFVGINTLFTALCRHPGFRQLDFSQLKLTLAGGMALTTEVARSWRDITGCEVNQGYGLTETSPVVSVNPPGNNQLGTIGLPVPGTQVKLVDDEGRNVASGEPGELCVKGPQVMEGYWQRPEATAEAIDSDGWFRTGDIAVMEANGYLKIVDRKKDMILVSGFNVYPNELEEVLASHPAVLECAAIGVPDEKTGEAIRMFVVAKAAVTPDELKSFCRERLTGYKVPRQFVFVEQLPKSNVGKILRKELRHLQPDEVLS